jgi:hypothetical protein
MANNVEKVLKHLKGDIKTFKHEAQEDKDLIKSLKGKKMAKKSKVFKKDKALFKKAKKIKRSNEAKENKIEKVMHEFKEGSLKSGSKKGPKVTNRKQAIAIALSSARKLKKKRK